MRTTLPLLVLLLTACSAEVGVNDVGAAPDDAETMAADEACERLFSGYHDAGLALECATTSPKCPMLVTWFGGGDLVSESAVQACSVSFRGASDCESLYAALDTCEL